MRRKIRVITIIAAIFLSGLFAKAETVSQRQAKQIATTFFNAAAGQVMAAPKLVYNGRRLTTGSYFAPFYVYNHPAGGYVVISAENKTFPILAYSLKGSFDPDKIGEQQKALLTQYARHIENIRYDSRVPYEAVEAWGDIRGHIASILEARYEATDPKEDKQHASEELERLAASDQAEGSMSVLYSPDQWEEMINSELNKKGEVPLGLISRRGEIYPAIVYGRKGDFYRIWLDERDNSLWRLMPSEIESEGELALFSSSPAAEDGQQEEAPFAYYASYAPKAATHYAPEASRLYRPDPEDSYPADALERRGPERSGIADSLISYEPTVRAYGSGHFSVTLPEEVISMRVYGLDGQMVQRDTFRETNTANVDLVRNPTGFYFAVFFGTSGRPYSVKLFR